jgi:hypothetical protein
MCIYLLFCEEGRSSFYNPTYCNFGSLVARFHNYPRLRIDPLEIDLKGLHHNFPFFHRFHIDYDLEIYWTMCS